MRKHLFLLSALLMQVAAVSVFAQDKYVDLGLSVKWATCNVGAATPLEMGNSTKWNPDNTQLLQGEDWRTPSYDEMIELLSYCTFNWVDNADSCGFKITSVMEGFTDRSIFIPVLKTRVPKNIYEVVSDGNGGGHWIKLVDSTYSYSYTGNYLTNFINNRNEPGYLDCGVGHKIPAMRKNGYPVFDDFVIRPVQPLDSLTKQNRVLPQVEVSDRKPSAGVIISGVVYDKEGPMMMVDVTERDSLGRVVANAITDREGEFLFKLVNPDDTLTISYVGYKTVKLPFTSNHFEVTMVEDDD